MDVHSGQKLSTSSPPPRFYLVSWRVCNICMAFFFALAAYVQVAYLIPAVLSFLVGLNPPVTDNFIWKHVSLMHITMCFMVATLWGWYLHRHAKNTIFHEEEGREFLGLVIIIIWMLLCQNSGKYLGGFKISVAVFITVLPFVMWLYYYINKELRASWPEHCKNTI
ncbi:transmembrane protein 220 isoform X2 [Mobula birostris]|uniref:transmembrane protein 220 isoform X2 n=1 Tax=Mobula birostris TaxID=1983395 RepID=UPI003B282AD7